MVITREDVVKAAAGHELARGPGVRVVPRQPCPRKKIFIEVMTSDHQLKASTLLNAQRRHFSPLSSECGTLETVKARFEGSSP